MKTLYTFCILFCVVSFYCLIEPAAVTNTVINKRFVPHNNVLKMVRMAGSNNMEPVMFGENLVPVWVHNPEIWVLTIQPYDSNGNSLRVREINVDKNVYEAAKIGEPFIE